MSPRVSLVVPVFNKEEHLEECLDSLLAQSLSDLELICVDDASTDASAAILENYGRSDKRIRLLKNASNAGAARARNAGLDHARGQFIRFVDADDVLPPDSTLALYERATATNADLVRGSIELFRGEQTNVVSTVKVNDRWTTSFSEASELWVPWWHTTYLISSKLLNDNHIRYPQLRRGEDPVFIASALVASRVISTIDKVVYRYRKYSKSTGSAGTGFDDVEDTLRHARLIKELYLSRHAACWQDGYGPFLLKDFLEFIGRCELNASQRQFVIREAEEIWADADGQIPEKLVALGQASRRATSA